MSLIKHLTVCQCFIFGILYDIGNVEALIGPNVRQGRENEFLFVVSIINNNQSLNVEDNHFCTGSLISVKDVITAEHCLAKKKLNNVQIIVGSIDLRLGKKYYPLWWVSYKKWAMHKKRPIEFAINDVAIIRLTENVHAPIRPGNLWIVPNHNLYGLHVQVAGWGTSSNGDHPRIIETAELEVLKNSECEKKIEKLLGKKLFFHDRLFCTSGIPFALLNSGDSGGPLLYNNKIVGINYGTCPGFTDENLLDLPCLSEQLNVHFGADYYRNFILDILYNF